MSEALPPFDAVLLLSFGGPEGPGDVMPFLENVTRGRGVPKERLDEVAAQYLSLGGRSPINDECRSLVRALSAELERRGPRLPVYWGNRNWHPLLAGTVAQMARDGVRRTIAIATSAYSSYSSCRQYLEDIQQARSTVGASAPLIEKIPPYWESAGFIDTMIEHTRAALHELAASKSGSDPDSLRLLFTAHSIPSAMAASCDYLSQLEEASAIVAAAAAPGLEWDLVFQSRSGQPSVPWLGPDVSDYLRTLAGDGIRGATLVPIGFVADHMEVIYDLDIRARAVADSLGIAMTRAACVGSAPLFVAGLRDLIAAAVPAEGGQSRCRPDCCPAPSRH